MLQARHLSVHYGEKAVIEDLNLSLEDNEILMLVGPTGCGKTTILRALAGLVPIAAGDIRLGNMNIDKHRYLPPEKRNIGMVFQDFALFPHLNVEQNVSFRLRDKAPADYWLATLGLEPLRKVLPQSLSGGQKQRVALARSLAHSPALMLLDEPLSNLDAALKDSLRWDIRGVLKAANVPAIWVTHDQHEALSVGDRLGVLNYGRLEQVDTPESCFCRPATRFVAGFLGEAGFLTGRLEGNHVATELGSVPAAATNGAAGEVDILLRPDDLTLAPASPGNGCVVWERYEGGSRLYAVRLHSGADLKIRVSHELRLPPAETVQVRVTTTHPLAAFTRA